MAASRKDHAELLARLSEGVAALTVGDEWRRYLRMQSRFHRYSTNNVLLILAQRPDATNVAGFGTWRALKRHVRRGERAIFILAPMLWRVDDEESNERLAGFKWVAVFDISQTEGAPLPKVCSPLTGDDPDACFERLALFAANLGFSVEDHAFDEETHGDCSHDEHRIRVRFGDAPAQRVKSLAHEIAHGLLHERFTSRALAELEAESVAYVVCQSLGIDSASYSFGYLATWSGGGEVAGAALRSSAARIQAASEAVVSHLESLEPLAVVTSADTAPGTARVVEVIARAR